MMKILLIISLFIITSCLQQETISTGETQETTIITTDNTGNTNNNNNNTDNGNNNNNSGNTGGNTSTPTNSCYGTNQPVRDFNIIMAGGQSWTFGLKGNSGVYGDFYDDLNFAGLFLPSDSRFKAKFHVKSQPIPNTGQEYCHGRAIGQSSDQYRYTKLKFAIHLRDVICTQYSSSNSSCPQCISAYLGSRYASQIIDATSVNSATQVIDLSHRRNSGSNIIATTIEIDDVRADSTCQANGTNCPSEFKVRNASCWNIRMQIATDYTQDLN